MNRKELGTFMTPNGIRWLEDSRMPSPPLEYSLFVNSMTGRGPVGSAALAGQAGQAGLKRNIGRSSQKVKIGKVKFQAYMSDTA